MELKKQYSEKLKKLIFVEIKKEKINQVFNCKIEENIFLPFRASDLVDQVKGKDDVNLNSIPFNSFVEGMFYTLGLDKNFKFSKEYSFLIKRKPDFIKLIKGKIYNEIKINKLEDAYIYLRGLLVVESTFENYQKIVIVLEELRKENIEYEEQEVEILQEWKSCKEDSAPYYYEFLLNSYRGDYEASIKAFNNFISKGGIETKEIKLLKDNILRLKNYEDGKNLVYEEPVKALNLLLPLMQIEEFNKDPQIYFYIAICYRKIGNYEKAIFYLNDALSIDTNMIEIINEIGLNYASLQDYENAVKYFRKVFGATKSIDVCTNLIMCYINLGDMEKARLHMDIAEKLDPTDEIMIQIKNTYFVNK